MVTKKSETGKEAVQRNNEQDVRGNHTVVGNDGEVGLVTEGNEAETTGFTRKRQVNVPLISMAHRDRLYCLVNGEITQAPMGSFARSDSKTVPVCHVTDLESGQDGLLICTALVESALTKCPGGYVGKRFEISQGTPIPGKRYRALDVFELA